MRIGIKLDDNNGKKANLSKENDAFTDDLYSSSEDNSKEENFFADDDSIYDSNEKVVEVSPDGNFGKVIEIFYNFYISTMS